MLKFGLDLLVTKYSHDAEQELQARQAQEAAVKRRREQTQRRMAWLKRVLLLVALAGVAAGVYFAHDLGWMTGELLHSRTEESVSSPPPPSKAKAQRRVSEMKKQRQDDLDEVMK